MKIVTVIYIGGYSGSCVMIVTDSGCYGTLLGDTYLKIVKVTGGYLSCGILIKIII